MAITATTLAAAVGVNDTVINVASATGITAPNFTAGTGIVYLLVDTEFMSVLSVTGTFVSVQRGQFGTGATAHVINGQVQIGLPGDFAPITEFITNSVTSFQTEASLKWPATFLSGSADVIPASVPGFYVVKTAGVNAMTLAVPPASAEGNIIYVSSDTTNAHTITCPSAILASGLALKTIATFPAFRGAMILLRVCNGVYHVISTGGSAGVAVLS